MRDASAYHNTRSATLFATEIGAAALILFEGTWYRGSEFNGIFIQLTNAHDTAEWDWNVPPEFHYDRAMQFPIPMTGTMLVLQTQRRPELRLSFRDAITPLWNTFTAERLPEQAILKGAPTLTWAAFPQNVEFLSSDSIYLHIRQRLEIDFTDLWSNYAAEFEYWLHLHLDDGVVSGHVAKWIYWVERGAFSQLIDAILRPNLELGVHTINDSLATALAAVPPTVTGIYYLPGRQLAPVGSGLWNVHWQKTESDVTVVFEM